MLKVWFKRCFLPFWALQSCQFVFIQELQNYIICNPLLFMITLSFLLTCYFVGRSEICKRRAGVNCLFLCISTFIHGTYLFNLSHGSKIVKYVHFLCMHGSQHIHVLACLCRMMDILSCIPVSTEQGLSKAQPLSYKPDIFFIHSKDWFTV